MRIRLSQGLSSTSVSRLLAEGVFNNYDHSLMMTANFARASSPTTTIAIHGMRMATAAITFGQYNINTLGSSMCRACLSPPFLFGRPNQGVALLESSAWLNPAHLFVTGKETGPITLPIAKERSTVPCFVERDSRTWSRNLNSSSIFSCSLWMAKMQSVLVWIT